MPFENAKPVEVGAKAGGPYCRASVRGIGGRSVVKITVNEDFLDEYLPDAKAGTMFNVKYGTGPDEGTVLIASSPSGSVELRKYIKKSFTLSVSSWAKLRGTTHKSRDCRVVTGDQKSVAIKLPF